MRGLLISVMLGSLGCATVSTIGTAETLPHKQLQLIAAPEMSVSGARGESLRVPLPELSVGARYGVTERFEAGLKTSVIPFGNALTTVSVEGSGKYQLKKRMAVAGSLGYRWARVSGADYEIISMALPLYLGIDLGERFQLVVGPRIGNEIWLSAGANPIHLPFIGSSLGLVWEPNDRWTFVPEVTFLRSPTAMDQSQGTAMFHIGFGILLNTRK